jgi:hypothetical protein
MAEIRIDIAGICVALSMDDPDVASWIRTHYADFIYEDGSPEVRVEVQVQEGPDFIPREPGPWVLETDYQNGRLEFLSYGEKGSVHLASGEGSLILRPAARIENFLRVLYAWRCIEHQALLVHSSGVLRGDRAVVFFGPSGSGKTTISRLAAHHTILSDDLVILKRTNGLYSAYGVPFRGEAVEFPPINAQGKVRGLFRLRKGTEHRITSLKASRGFSELVASVPFVLKGEMVGAVLAIAHDIVGAVPVGELYFHRDEGFWRVIDAYC